MDLWDLLKVKSRKGNPHIAVKSMYWKGIGPSPMDSDKVIWWLPWTVGAGSLKKMRKPLIEIELEIDWCRPPLTLLLFGLRDLWHQASWCADYESGGIGGSWSSGGRCWSSGWRYISNWSVFIEIQVTLEVCCNPSVWWNKGTEALIYWVFESTASANFSSLVTTAVGVQGEDVEDRIDSIAMRVRHGDFIARNAIIVWESGTFVEEVAASRCGNKILTVLIGIEVYLGRVKAKSLRD